MIQRCTFFNGWHTTGLDLETGSSGCNGDLDSVIFRNNLIYDDENKAAPYAISIWVQGPHGGAGEIHKAYFYNNIIKYQSMRGIAFEYVTGAHVYNNVFYGDNNSANGIIQCFPGYSSTGIKVKNNIFYTTLTNANTSLFATYGMSNSEVDADYNLYYASTLNTAIVYSGAGYQMNDIATIRSKFGWEMHSPTPADPLFVSSTDYHLKAGSPAIGAGIAIQELPLILKGTHMVALLILAVMQATQLINLP